MYCQLLEALIGFPVPPETGWQLREGQTDEVSPKNKS